ncbi:ankyrin repeat-containing protein [Colletotrichum chrysophilum]|uniref:Ankyrin repeat-containing protein n=1 Tax=Colletotrichum chrysophilum TaxID=1836956 RepID=A0AAD9ABX9_9PEZI|nr:ankyrin repeat-containing protein [Colletotrichum chrysophilum]
MDHFRRINGYTRGGGTNATSNNTKEQRLNVSSQAMSDNATVYYSASEGSTDDESTSESDLDDEDFRLLGQGSASFIAPSAESSTGSRVWDTTGNNTSLETLATTCTEASEPLQQKFVLIPERLDVFQYQVPSSQGNSAPALPTEEPLFPCVNLGHRKDIPPPPSLQPGEPTQVSQNHGPPVTQRRSTADKRRRHRTSSRRASNIASKRSAISLAHRTAGPEVIKTALTKACKKPSPSSTLVEALVSLVTERGLQSTSFYKQPILDCVKLATKKHNKCLRIILEALGSDKKRMLDKIQRSDGNLLRLILTRTDREPLTRYNVKAMEMLLNAGVDPNDTANGTRPALLHQAVDVGVSRAVSLLLSWGADPQIRNSAGLNALDLAKQCARNVDGAEDECQKMDREKILTHLMSITS